PGRFFAGNEAKVTIANVLTNYGMKLEGRGTRLPNRWFGCAVMPNPEGNICFRRRQ
ncbi:hypothetical protein FOMPIDRAFT_1082188, partial [Fomitopsis schrenkii]